jgi:hypothetical protein
VANISFGGNYATMAKRFSNVAQARLRKAVAMGLTDVAFDARKNVQQEMRDVFAAPTQFTLSSVRVKPADSSKPIGEQTAEVFIRDDYPKTNTSPRKYLLPEELGGTRGNKRSEDDLQAAGILMAGVQTTPAGRPISGPQMVLLLSGVKAFGEQGYDANATSKTTKRLKAMKAVLSAKTGTPFFVAKSKLGEGGMGIFQIVSKGKVRALLWFDTKRPTYRPRFHFQDVVAQTAKRIFARQVERAITRLTAEKR